MSHADTNSHLLPSAAPERSFRPNQTTEEPNDNSLLYQFFRLFDGKEDEELVTNLPPIVPVSKKPDQHDQYQRLWFDLMKSAAQFQFLLSRVEHFSGSRSLSAEEQEKAREHTQRLGTDLANSLPPTILSQIQKQLRNNRGHLNKACQELEGKMKALQREEKCLQSTFQSWCDTSLKESLDMTPLLDYLSKYREQIELLEQDLKEKKQILKRLDESLSAVPNNKYDHYCPICRTDSKERALTRCGHLFCSSCISRLMDHDDGAYHCPICRKSSEETLKIYL